MGFMEDIQQAIGGFREKTYPRIRNAAADALLQPGGKGTHESAKDYFHRQGNSRLTEMLGSVLAPQAAANVSDALYMGNEAVTGGLARLAGKPFFSKYGFNWPDVAINRRGQDEAVKKLDKRWEGVRQGEPTRRFLYRGVE